MKADDSRFLSDRKSRIDERLDPSWQEVRERPMLAGTNGGYEVSGRVTALSCGGIGLVHELARSLGLAEAIDRHVHVFKRHSPYHESDHVLNLAYNVLAGGTCLEDLERLRHDAAYLDALGRGAFPIRRRRATSCVGSTSRTSSRSWRRSTRCSCECGSGCPAGSASWP